MGFQALQKLTIITKHMTTEIEKLHFENNNNNNNNNKNSQ